MRLPESVQQLADVIGCELALLLVGQLPKAYSRDKRYPGAKSGSVVMYVPSISRLGADHQLVRIVGWHAAVRLSKAFGGEIMYPATCQAIYREFRNESIIRLSKQGVKKAHLAEWFDVDERTIRNLTRENPPEELIVAANDNAQVHIQARA